LKCDGTRAETRFCLSAKRTSPFKSAGASVQSTTGSRGVRFGGSNVGYTMFRGSVKGTGSPLHSPVSPSLPLPCVTVCHHISTGLYQTCLRRYGPCRDMLSILHFKIRFHRSGDRPLYIIAIRLVSRPHKVLLRASHDLLANRSSPVHQMLNKELDEFRTGESVVDIVMVFFTVNYSCLCSACRRLLSSL